MLNVEPLPCLTLRYLKHLAIQCFEEIAIWCLDCRYLKYIPEGTNQSKHSREDLMRIQRSLSGEPRETLGYRMPVEKLAKLVALTG